MAQPQSPRQQFVGMLMWFAVIFLGWQLFMGSRNTAPDSRTAPQLLAEMKALGAKGDLNNLRAIQPVYERKAEDDLKKEGKPATEIERMKLASAVIVGHAQVEVAKKATNVKDAVTTLELAYNPLHAKERALFTKPLWTEPIEVTIASEGQDPKRVSAKELFSEITKQLDQNYKRDYVWGLVQGYYFIDALVNLTGRNPHFSYAFAALLLAICVRAIIWPLAQRQLMWSRQMTQLQPLVKELEAAYKKKDPSGAYKTTPEYQQKVMGMYQEYGINPMKGCLPMLAQMPLFFFVYACMLHYRFAFREGTFFWINPTTSANTNGFTSPSLGEPDTILLVIYGISMIVSTFLAPVTDPTQVKQQRILGISVAVIFTFFMYFGFPVPSAFVLYWIFTNVFSAAQSYRAYKLPLAPLEKKGATAPGGGIFPSRSGSNHGKPSSNGVTSDGPKPQKPSKGKK